MKKILSVLLSLCLLCSVIPAAWAEEPVPAEPRGCEYPLIVVSGMDFSSGLYRNPGTEEETPAGVSFNAGELFKALFKTVGAAASSFSIRAGVNVILDYAYTLFADYACDENGDSLDPAVTNPVYPLSAGNYERFNDPHSSHEAGITSSAVARYGGDNVYFFFYDWRLDPIDNAALLNDTVNGALAAAGKDKVDIICCSMGGIVTLSYLTEYGHGKVDTLLSDSSTMYGTDVATDLFTGNYKFDADAARRYLTNMLPAASGLIGLLAKTGVLGKLCAFLMKFADKYENEIYEKVLCPVFASMPAFWSIVRPERYEEAKAFTFGGREEQYAGVIARADRVQAEVVAKREQTLAQAMADGMKFAVIANYNTPLVCAYENAGLQGDGILETRMMSFGALVSEVGGVLSDEELARGDAGYVSADGCINASTCLYPDQTWFIKDAEHVACQYDSELMMFVFALLESEEQPTVGTWAEYPQFMQADGEEHLYTLGEYTAPEKGLFPVC